MTAEEFLEYFNGINRLIAAEEAYKQTLQNEIHHMSMIAPVVPKRAATLSPIQEALQIAYSLMEETDTRIKDYQQKLEVVAGPIKALPDPFLQKILYAHYIQGKDWPVIAEESHYCIQTIFRKRRQALELLEVPEKYQQIAADAFQHGELKNGDFSAEKF